MLSKRQTLLDLDPELNDNKDADDPLVYFTNVSSLVEDAGEESLDEDQLVCAMVSEDTWEQMGQPAVITVTVEPGDKLNPVKDPAQTLSDLKDAVGGKKVAD